MNSTNDSKPRAAVFARDGKARPEIVHDLVALGVEVVRRVDPFRAAGGDYAIPDLDYDTLLEDIALVVADVTPMSGGYVPMSGSDDLRVTDEVVWACSERKIPYGVVAGIPAERRTNDFSLGGINLCTAGDLSRLVRAAQTRVV
jgi:hypothetical protein